TKGTTITTDTTPLLQSLSAIVGTDHIRTDALSLEQYGEDALGQPHSPDIVLIPANTAEGAAIAAGSNAEDVPMVVRGAGTGYTGGAVPTAGGVLISMERFNRIMEID